MWSGMSALANVLISNFYVRMKDDFPKGRHEFWEESPLEEINLKYAAVDGYVSPRGRYDECSSKFSLGYETKIIEPVGDESVDLHTTQLRYFASTKQ